LLDYEPELDKLISINRRT